MQVSEAPKNTVQENKGDESKDKSNSSEAPKNTVQENKGDESKDKCNLVEEFVKKKGVKEAVSVSLGQPENIEERCKSHDQSYSKHHMTGKPRETSNGNEWCTTMWKQTEWYGPTCGKSSPPFMRLWWKETADKSTDPGEGTADNTTDPGKESVPHPSVVYELLTSIWELKEPKLIVSVIGDVDPFIPENLKQAFQEGIEMLLKTPDTWLLVDCRDRELFKLIDKSVERLTEKEKNNAVAIGVAHWGSARTNDKLPTKVTKYGMTDMRGDGNGTSEPESCLTHFILVDDARYERSSAVAEFIATFQSYIATLGREKHELKAPVSLLFGGSEEIGTTALEAKTIIEKGLPLVTIKGSGCVADSMSNLFIPSRFVYPRNKKDNEPSCKLSQKRKDMEDMKKILENIKVDDHRWQVQVCVLDGEPTRSATEGLNVGLNAAVLRAFIDWSNYEKPDKDDPLTLSQQIDLAILLNESKTAEDHIFERIKKLKKSEMPEKWKKDCLKNLEDALVNNLHSFVELFLKAKYEYCNLDEFDEVLELYRRMPRSALTTDESIVSLIKKASEEAVHHKDCGRSKKKSEEVRANSTRDQTADSNTFLSGGFRQIGRMISKLVGPHYELAGDYRSGNSCKDKCWCGFSIRKSSQLPDAEKEKKEEEKEKEEKTEKEKKKKIMETDVGMKKEEEKTDVVTHLFLWAVLFNRMDMAYFFWKHGTAYQYRPKDKDKGKDTLLTHPHIIMALMASTILSKLAKKAQDGKEPDLHQSLAEHAQLFEDRASAVLMECSTNDRHTTQDLLTREHSSTIWGNGTTLLNAAFTGKRKRFLERMPCRVKLDAVWRGKMVWSTRSWKVFLTTIFPFLICLIKFTENEEPVAVFNRMMGCNNRSGDSKDGDKEKPSRSKKLYIIGKKSDDKMMTVHWMSALIYFYSAPITKFYGCTWSYLVFLGLFSYTCLTNLKPGMPSTNEAIVWAWICLFIIEEIRQIWDSSENHNKNFSIWKRDHWNKFDALLYFLISPLCLTLRMTLDGLDFQHARNAFAITLACYFFRFLQTYYAFKDVGSKVVMIFHMMKDLAKFGSILFVFIISYGVAITIVLYPNRPPSLDLFKYVLYSPFWQIFVRDAFVDKVDGEDGAPSCSGNLTSSLNGDESQCHVDTWFADVLLVLYTMFTNVLLLNVLIAMFNSTFERFQRESTTWWHYNRYAMVEEYLNRPMLAPPLIIISYIYRIVRSTTIRCKCGCDYHKGPSPLCQKSENNKLRDYEFTDFERINMEKRMERLEKLRKKLKEAGVTSKQADQIWETGRDDDDDELQTGVTNTGVLEQIMLDPATTKLNAAVERWENLMNVIEERFNQQGDVKPYELSCCRIRTDLYSPGGVQHIPFRTHCLPYQQSEKPLYKD